MRKYVVTVLLVVIGLCWAGVAYAEGYTNDTYDTLFNVMNICCKGAKTCHDACKVDCYKPCKPKCEPCKPKCEPCKPKCEPCCKPQTCTPPPCECKEVCCPEPVTEFPDPCRGSADPFIRDGLSRKDAWF